MNTKSKETAERQTASDWKAQDRKRKHSGGWGHTHAPPPPASGAPGRGRTPTAAPPALYSSLQESAERVRRSDTTTTSPKLCAIPHCHPGALTGDAEYNTARSCPDHAQEGTQTQDRARHRQAEDKGPGGPQRRGAPQAGRAAKTHLQA